MKSDLINQINIGKDTESKLMQVGIDSFSKLKSIGSEQAFLQLQTLDPGACLDLLYGLEGAIQGIKWNKLPIEKNKLCFNFTKWQIRNKPTPNSVYNQLLGTKLRTVSLWVILVQARQMWSCCNWILKCPGSRI